MARFGSEAKGEREGGRETTQTTSRQQPTLLAWVDDASLEEDQGIVRPDSAARCDSAAGDGEGGRPGSRDDLADVRAVLEREHDVVAPLDVGSPLQKGVRAPADGCRRTRRSRDDGVVVMEVVGQGLEVVGLLSNDIFI